MVKSLQARLIKKVPKYKANVISNTSLGIGEMMTFFVIKPSGRYQYKKTSDGWKFASLSD